jgi:putative membrane protein
MTAPGGSDDPRVYLAAERTLLAWIRTGVALMAFGFVVARFGVFLREMTLANPSDHAQKHGLSLYVGLILICTGVVVLVVSAMRHRAYVRALDEGRFRERFGSTFAFVVVGLLAVAGVVMALVLLRL